MTRRHNGEDEQSPSDRLTLVSQDLALRALSVVVQHRMKPGRPNPYPKLFEDDYASLRLSLIKYRVDSMPTIDRIYADVEELKSSLQHNYLNIVGYVDKAIQGHLDAKVQSMPQAEGLLPEPIDPATMEENDLFWAKSKNPNQNEDDNGMLYSVNAIHKDARVLMEEYVQPMTWILQHQTISYIHDLQSKLASLHFSLIAMMQKQELRFTGRDSYVVYQLRLWALIEELLEMLECCQYSFALFAFLVKWKYKAMMRNDREYGFYTRSEAIEHLEDAKGEIESFVLDREDETKISKLFHAFSAGIAKFYSFTETLATRHSISQVSTDVIALPKDATAVAKSPFHKTTFMRNIQHLGAFLAAVKDNFYNSSGSSKETIVAKMLDVFDGSHDSMTLWFDFMLNRSWDDLVTISQSSDALGNISNAVEHLLELSEFKVSNMLLRCEVDSAQPDGKIDERLHAAYQLYLIQKRMSSTSFTGYLLYPVNLIYWDIIETMNLALEISLPHYCDHAKSLGEKHAQNAKHLDEISGIFLYLKDKMIDNLMSAEEPKMLSMVCMGPLIEYFAGTWNHSKIIDRLAFSYFRLFISSRGSWLWKYLIEREPTLFGILDSHFVILNELFHELQTSNPVDPLSESQITFVTVQFTAIDLLCYNLYVNEVCSFEDWNLKQIESSKAITIELKALLDVWKRIRAETSSCSQIYETLRIEKLTKLHIMLYILENWIALERKFEFLEEVEELVAITKVLPSMEMIKQVKHWVDKRDGLSVSFPKRDLDLLDQYLCWVELLLQVALLKVEVVKGKYSRWDLRIDSKDLFNKSLAEFNDIKTNIIQCVGKFQPFIVSFWEKLSLGQQSEQSLEGPLWEVEDSLSHDNITTLVERLRRWTLQSQNQYEEVILNSVWTENRIFRGLEKSDEEESDLEEESDQEEESDEDEGSDEDKGSSDKKVRVVGYIGKPEEYY